MLYSLNIFTGIIMNNKFLITVFFLQSYLFAADLPYKELQIQSTHVNFEELENIIKNGDTQTLINILNSNCPAPYIMWRELSRRFN